jgi:predicted nucleic-acid-binding Zn-ribbon protein
MGNEIIKCPKCESQQIYIDKKGFGTGKALSGAVLTGGVGILAGCIGKNKLVATCLKCNYKFNPSDGYRKVVDDGFPPLI